MNQVDIKQQLYILIGAILGIYFFADSLLLGTQPKMIGVMKSQMVQLENNQQSMESLQRTKKSLQDTLEESKSKMEDLFIRFPSNVDTENNRSAIIANITQGLIVKKDNNTPKSFVDYSAKELEKPTVPKVLDEDKELEVPNVIRVANYKSAMDLSANYFEILEFFHALANQDIFFLPTLIVLDPDEEVPYGIQGKIELLTFGFEGLKEEEKR